MAKQQTQDKNQKLTPKQRKIKIKKRRQNRLEARQEREENRPDLFRPGSILRDEDLQRGVRQMVNMQVGPTLRAARRGENRIRRLTKDSLGDLNRQQSAGVNSINSIYQQGAAENAKRLIGARINSDVLRGQMASQGAQVQNQIGAAEAGAQSGMGANTTGQSISARDNLAQMVAMSKAGAARDTQTWGNLANTVGTVGEQTLRGLGAAQSMHGRASVDAYRRQLAEQKAEVRRDSRENLNDIRGEAREARAQVPGLVSEALMGLRETERDWIGATAALGQKKMEAAAAGDEPSSVDYAKASGAQQRKTNAQEHKQQMAYLKAQGASYAQLARLKGNISATNMAAMQAGYNKGGGGSGGGSGSDGYRTYDYAKSYLLNQPKFHPKQLVKGEGKMSAKQMRNKAYNLMRVNGVSKPIAKRVIKKLVQNYKKKNKRPRGNDNVGWEWGNQGGGSNFGNWDDAWGN